MATQKNKGGRKGKYEEWLTNEGLIKIEGWARDGLTNEQISQNIGVTAKTLYEWQNRFSELSEALKRGKDVIDRQVENALLKRALGYKYDEVTRESVVQVNKETGKKETVMVETKIVTKQVSPDTTAQIFWLKNRKPAQWRDKQEVEHSGNMTVNNPVKNLTTEELRKLIDK